MTTHDPLLDTRESQPLPEPPSGELATLLRDKIKAKWDEANLTLSEYLDPTKPFIPIDWALSIHNKGVFAFDDYTYLQGQAGHGKSFTMSIYEAVILGATFGDIRYIGSRKKPKILHIDTEQSVGNVQLHKVRVYHMAGWAQDSDHRDQYQILMLRQTPNPVDRWAKVIRACYDFQPDFLFLDGMLDVVVGMNKEEECNLVISDAGAIAELFHMCMVGICHENPENSKSTSEGPAKPAGHIGSYSQRKGSAGQSTKKKLDGTTPTFEVTPKKVRNMDYEGFRFGIKDEPITINGKVYYIGIPYWVGDAAPANDDNDENAKVRSAVLSLHWTLDGKSYTEFESGLRSLGITSNRKLSDYITISQNIGLVYKDGKRYKVKYEENGIDIEKQTSLDDNSGAPF